MVTQFKRWFMVIIFLFIIMFFVLMIQTPLMDPGSFETNVIDNKNESLALRSSDYEDVSGGKWRKLSEGEINKLSKLGEILYLDRDIPDVNTSAKTYTILVWKYGIKLENRHIKRYTNKRFDPFEYCSVKNCDITYKSEDITKADLVIFHLHRMRGTEDLPSKPRNASQIWTFLTDESPYNTFMYADPNKLKNFNGYFNWSMTYRMDSDIPVPYGRTVALRLEEKGEDFNFDAWNASKRQDVLVAIMGSHCAGKNHRWKYVEELQKHIPIDRYGLCGTLKCDGHFDKDCDELRKYKFYLSFENSNCDEYITEKLWWNAYAKDSIPISMGTSRKIYSQLLPPNSYINVDDFASPRDLANYLYYLNDNRSEMKKYFKWKRSFKILNEHGYFGTPSYHYCRMCEALNYNSRESKVYTKLEDFWNKDNNCYPAWDT